MFILKKLGCRIYQTAFRAALPFLPYREPEIISSCGDIGEILKKEKLKFVLIATTKGTVERGLTLPIEKSLDENGIGYAIYDSIKPDPTVDNVEEALELYRQNNCDSLIAIGGGSAIDCAKAIGARAAYPDKRLSELRGVLKVFKPIPTLIAIPTTAGTGSEVTPAAVIKDAKQRKKYALMSFPLIPKYAVLDASLTYTMPPTLTATTGMDALTHAVEAYIGCSTTKKTRRLALEAVKTIFENLERAYLNGKDAEAREKMLKASYDAGIAFSVSYVGYVHAIAHSLGGMYGIPHGFANAVILPYVLEEYGKSAEKKLYRLAIAIGVANEADDYAVGARKFIQAVRALNSKMDIPNVIEQIKAEDVYEMSRCAEREANPLYPVPKLMTGNELEKIYFKISSNK